MQITMTRDALINRLKDRLSEAQKEDERTKKAHEKEEQAALVAWRKRLREALSWPYSRAKNCGHYRGESLDFKAPSCPNRESESIGAVLRMIEISTSKTFHVSDKTDVGMAVNWQPKSQQLGKTLCD